MMDHEKDLVITQVRYEALVKAETICELARQAYSTAESYALKDRLAVLFGPIEKPLKADTPGELPEIPEEIFK